MIERFKSSDAVLKSIDSSESIDSAKQNLPKADMEELKIKANQRAEQKKLHEKVEEKDRLKADSDLDSSLSELGNEIITKQNLTQFVKNAFSGSKDAYEVAKKYLDKQSLYGVEVTFEELKSKVTMELSEKDDLSIGDKVRNLKEHLTSQGKSQVEILNTLISKFENEEAVSTWVENFRNMLALHDYAQNKPPQERKAIQTIIANADLSSENSFDLALTKIGNNSEISAETKEEIALKFGKISTVGEMDSTLSQLKDHKKGIEKAISGKTEAKETLESEISDLEKQIEGTEPYSEERKELEEKLAEKVGDLKSAEAEIRDLKESVPQDVSFPLREGFTAKLNSDGSRVIRIDGLNFDLRIPDNKMPFQGKKNMLAINTAFSYSALYSSGMESLFNPALVSGDEPDKNHRVLSAKILTALGYADDVILSQDQIKQLARDIGVLKKDGNTTGMEDLSELGIWDNATKEVNVSRFKTCLNFIKQNRGKTYDFDDIRSQR